MNIQKCMHVFVTFLIPKISLHALYIYLCEVMKLDTGITRHIYFRFLFAADAWTDQHRVMQGDPEKHRKVRG